MSDENVGGLVASISAIETPEIGLHKLLVQRGADLSDLDRARVKRAIDALSAHGQPVVDEVREQFGGLLRSLRHGPLMVSAESVAGAIQSAMDAALAGVTE